MSTTSSKASSKKSTKSSSKSHKKESSVSKKIKKLTPQQIESLRLQRKQKKKIRKIKRANINSTTSSNLPSDSSTDNSTDSSINRTFVAKNLTNKINAVTSNIQNRINTVADNVQDKIQTTTELVDTHREKLRDKINNTQRQIYEINDKLPVLKPKTNVFDNIINKKPSFDISSIVDKSKLASLSENDTENLIAQIVKAKIEIDHKEKAEQLVLGAKNALSKYSDQDGGWTFTESEPEKNIFNLETEVAENLFDSLDVSTKIGINNKYLNLHIDNDYTTSDMEAIFVPKINNSQPIITAQHGGYKTKMFKSFLSYFGVRFNE